ncbi:Homeobox Hox-B3-like protein [Hirschfeldia incana]|nr:Homeobox Hox-B3-like protein [Hirschfeldia incana]
MEDTTISNPSMMEPLLFPVDDPMSLLLSQNYSDNNNNNNLFGFVRGPRYGEYATLRESKLRLKREYETILKEEEERFFGGGGEKNKNNQTRFGFTREDEIRVSPEKKTRFGFKYNPNPRRLSSSSSCSLAQSVPDFSSMIRKENRRPANSNLLPKRTDLTPPPSKSKNSAVFGSARGSMSAGDKKRTVRKSYATVEDLKKVSMAAASGINGGGGRKSIGGSGRKSIGGGGGRTILGYRQIY